MKTKHTLIILAIGFLITLVGALFKILHFPYGNLLLLVGMSCEIFGVILLLYKILTHPKLKDFLNS